VKCLRRREELLNGCDYLNFTVTKNVSSGTHSLQRRAQLSMAAFLRLKGIVTSWLLHSIASRQKIQFWRKYSRTKKLTKNAFTGLRYIRLKQIYGSISYLTIIFLLLSTPK